LAGRLRASIFPTVDLLVATTNPHKAREFGELLEPLGIVVRGLIEVEVPVPAPIESEATFQGNARLKATLYARALGCVCLADDSGLEVDALGGAPGVLSARYAGEAGSREERDRRNREKVVRELRERGAQESPARLVCALCLADAAGTVLFETSASLEGLFRFEPRGGYGFGYDAHLFLPAAGKMAAELSPEEMNACSHRGQATRALAAWLAERR